MSRRLILMRHAQTAGKQAGQHDSDRMLTVEGEAQARNTGQYFVLNSLVPDFTLTSNAVRAVQTSRLILEAAGIAPEKVYQNEDLYEADATAWLTQIRLVAPEINTLLCIGHNPAISGLSSALVTRAIDLPPAGFVVLESTAPGWSDFDDTVKEFHPKKSLK